jgi:hypothetical protein
VLPLRTRSRHEDPSRRGLRELRDASVLADWRRTSSPDLSNEAVVVTELKPEGRYEWERIVRRVQMPATAKLVAFTIATYADKGGNNVRPGVARLAAVSCLSERSVRSGLTCLRELGLVERTVSGSANGMRRLTDEYRLTVPADLLERVDLLPPNEIRETEAVAPPATDSPVDNESEVSEHRQDVPLLDPEHRQDPPVMEADQRQLVQEHRQMTTGSPAGDDTPPQQDQHIDQEEISSYVTGDVTSRTRGYPHDCDSGFVGEDEDGHPVPCLICKPHLTQAVAS